MAGTTPAPDDPSWMKYTQLRDEETGEIVRDPKTGKTTSIRVRMSDEEYAAMQAERLAQAEVIPPKTAEQEIEELKARVAALEAKP